MKLTVKDRIVLVSILPAESDFRTMKTVMKLREALLLSEAEATEFAFENDGTSMKWNAKGNEAVEIEVGELAKEVIVKQLKKLDEQQKLTTDHMDVWEKFLPEGGTAA